MTIAFKRFSVRHIYMDGHVEEIFVTWYQVQHGTYAVRFYVHAWLNDPFPIQGCSDHGIW